MNWLIYTSGWFWGWGFVNAIYKAPSNSHFIVKFLCWTMTWIWICWRFV